MAERFYITTAISYPNGRPHIGHAYELIATDAIARFKRLDGYDVLFLTGTDEHGLKMLQTARAEGIDVRDLADRNAAEFQRMAEAVGASNDDFIRTTEARHREACQELWRRMAAAGDIYKASYGGWYSVREEAFYGEEESYYFRLSAYADRLLAHYEAHPDFIGPTERRNEVVSFVRQGLRDLSVSRTTFDWGIPVPDDPAHVMYVWVDALTNYVTATGFLGAAERREFWPADLHVIGKDIVRFHAVYWPAFLMSAGLPLPERVFGHGFLFNRGEKMSKSVGNVVDPFALVATYGLDPFRYFLLREVPFGQDGSYSHEAIVNRVNSELANDLGNLAQRSLSMVNKHCGAAVPQPGAFTEADDAILRGSAELLPIVRQAIDRQELHAMLAPILALVADANRYFAAQEPWALRKNDPERMATVLYVTAETLRRVAILLQPVMPQSAGRLLDLLAVEADERTFSELTPDTLLAPGRAMPTPAGVFPRYVEPDAA